MRSTGALFMVRAVQLFFFLRVDMGVRETEGCMSFIPESSLVHQFIMTVSGITNERPRCNNDPDI